MSKHDRQSAKASRHVRLYHWILQCAAWQSLDVYARAVYIDIASKYGGAGTNNGRLIYSCRQAAASLKISKGKASIALADLQDRGFIVAVTKGGFNRKGRAALHATEWRLTEFPCDVTNQMSTKDFTRWVAPANSEHGSPHEPHGSPGGRSGSPHGRSCEKTAPAVHLVNHKRPIRPIHGSPHGHS